MQPASSVTSTYQIFMILQIVALLTVIMGTVVSFGMLIQQIKSLADDLRLLRAEFQLHIKDRDIHPDSRRVSDIERKLMSHD